MDNKQLTPQQILNESYNGNGAVSTTPGAGGNLMETDLGNTVWGIRKVSTDLSLFHGIWTYNIPQAYWRISENGTALVDTDTSTKCVSSLGQMNMNSGATIGDITHLHSRRHPRYQPNRGHYYATAGYIPAPSATGIREWGLLSNGSAVMFRLTDGVLEGVMRNTVGTTKTVVLDLPAGADLSAGNLYDIQYHWRGVGNYYFYFNLKLVGVITNLGGGTQVSTANPAMAVHYRCENTDGTDVAMSFGCVDVTSEGGQKQGLTYVACTNDIGITQGRAVSGYDQPLIIMRVKETLYGVANTRDSVLTRISASSDNKSIMSIWRTRDITALGGTAYGDGIYQDAELGSSIEYIDCVPYSDTDITFDITKATRILGARVPQDGTSTIGNPSENIEFFAEQGDYLILCGARESGGACNMFGNLELGEEI